MSVQRPAVGGALGVPSRASSPTPTRSPSRDSCVNVARPARSPTRCCCSSIRPSTPADGAPAPRTCRWARTSTAPGHRRLDTDRGGKLTYHGSRPARRLSDHGIGDIGPLPAHDGRGDHRRPRRGRRAGALSPRRGHRLHRRVGAGPQDRLDRRARLPRRQHPRLCRQRGERSRALLLGRGLRPARRGHDLLAPELPRPRASGLRCFRRRMAFQFSNAHGAASAWSRPGASASTLRTPPRSPCERP